MTATPPEGAPQVRVIAMPADANSWNAMAVMALFAQQRHMAIAKAAREKTRWPPQWLTDVNAAYSVLARHPLGTDQLPCANKRKRQQPQRVARHLVAQLAIAVDCFQEGGKLLWRYGSLVSGFVRGQGAA